LRDDNISKKEEKKEKKPKPSSDGLPPLDPNLIESVQRKRPDGGNGRKSDKEEGGREKKPKG